MGNTGSNAAGNGRRRNSFHHHPPPAPYGAAPPPPPPQQPSDVSNNRFLFAATSPYPPQYPNPPNYYQYGYYSPPPPPAIPMPMPTGGHFDNHHGQHPGWVVPGGSFRANYPPAAYGPPMPMPVPAPYVEHQKAITIKNDVNIKKETLRVEPDELNPGRFLVCFTFDATVAGSITLFFFAKEGLNCNLTAAKEDLLKPVKVTFKEGLGQKFKQPSGTGIDFSSFDEIELVKAGDSDVYPLAVKAEASPSTDQGSEGESQKVVGASNSQITQALFEKKDTGEYRVRVVKQILWVSGTRYELQEIYGIGNSADTDVDGNDLGKECVICLSEPRDTTVLPCRHMCMCSECAKVLRFQTNRCPICRQPVDRLLEIKVNNRADEHQQENQQQEL